MKNTGVIRKVDELGRITIPREIRIRFNIEEKDELEFWIDKDIIIMKKYMSSCCICGENTDLIEFKGKLICKNCRTEILKLLN